MKDKESNIVKNKRALIAGISSALFFILYGYELLQSFSAYLFGVDNVGVEFHYIFINTIYEIPDSFTPFWAYIILLTPVITSLVLVQLSALFLQKAPLGFYRYMLMIFQLLVIGYLLIYLLFGAISIVLDFAWNTDLQKFVEFIHVEYPVNLIVVFMMIVVIALFINFNAKRITAYINK